ncbi:mobilization protein [Sphingomonas sp. GC_Shp_3]|uniref:mobilization protein n=1 Tax=Sphingomonas sp. GC_Shp_3 TaxID=2937383 RepID=UPI002269CE78|nr:mobilization protein [Sphingomonas sp. GC_Shp_3]
MALTLEQKIAQAQDNLARLKDKARSADTRQKIVVGAAVISQALRSSSLAGRLLAILEAEPLRDHDQKVVADLVEKLHDVSKREDAGIA